MAANPAIPRAVTDKTDETGHELSADITTGTPTGCGSWCDE